MAADLKLVAIATAENPNIGDLEVDGVDFVLVTGAAGKAQECECVLRTWLGEWYRDRSAGIPWVERILEKGVGIATVQEILARHLLEEVEGVEQVRRWRLTLDPVTRDLAGTVEVVFDGAVLAVQVGG